ncbi:MAG: T9SS type A sorting domain-containing protein [bacterium]|nr:T9SS type A sorting domain-containing protein [bacterium]
MLSRLLIAAALLAGALPAMAQPVTTADYEVGFDATWSAATHPADFPPDPHFSWLIGGTHDDQVDFWQVGTPASLGIQRMAEWGSNSPLDAEVQAAMGTGHAGQVIESDDYVLSPGMLAATFTATPAHPLATVVTMVAPSPDWFVGVAGLDLRDGNDWATEIVVDLYAYDAGTDSGPTYTSPNQATVPQDPIASIAGYPFASGVPLGTFTFRLLQVTAVPEAPSLSLAAYPTPFNPRTTVALKIPAAGPAQLAIHDVRGRLVRKLWDGRAQAGRTEVLWDGRSDTGRDAPSGVYLVRATTGGAVAVTRVVLAR